MLVDRLVQSFDAPPARITLDLDAFDDPAHGQQQLVIFHGYYEQYQCLSIAMTCAENALVVLVALRFGTCPAFLGADEDLRDLTRRLRAICPEMEIVIRSDGGFDVPVMYDLCEELRLTYTFGIGMNAVLPRQSQTLLEQAVTQDARIGRPPRLFQSLLDQAGSWSQPRRVVIRCEAHVQGTNRRAVVTDRPGAEVLLQSVYDEYTERGESENRNKELQCGLCADRLSDHRFLAKCFRPYLHEAELNLLVRLRRAVA